MEYTFDRYMYVASLNSRLNLNAKRGYFSRKKFRVMILHRFRCYNLIGLSRYLICNHIKYIDKAIEVIADSI